MHVYNNSPQQVVYRDHEAVLMFNNTLIRPLNIYN